MKAMGNMLTATLEIMGTRPLLFHAFGPDAIPLTKTERTGVAGNDPDEWKRRVCWNPNRQLYLEAPVVFACLRDAGRFTKKARVTLQSTIVATLQIEDVVVRIDRFLPEGQPPTDSTAPVYLDVRGVRMKASGAWNVRYRVAAAPGWRARFAVSRDKTLLSRAELNAVAIDADRYVEIGDGRKIGCGRFEVFKFRGGG